MVSHQAHPDGAARNQQITVGIDAVAAAGNGDPAVKEQQVAVRVEGVVRGVHLEGAGNDDAVPVGLETLQAVSSSDFSSEAPSPAIVPPSGGVRISPSAKPSGGVMSVGISPEKSGMRTVFKKSLTHCFSL